MKKFATLALAGILLAGTAVAQDTKQGVEVSVQVLSEKEITDTSGNKLMERVPLDVAIPDQTVIYKITVENGEMEAASNVALNIPVSESLLVQPDSFTGDIEMNVSFSVDGVEFGAFQSLTVTEGQKVRAATQGDIRAVRIDIPELPKGETYFIEYDAVVR